ncbi:MAG TPA: polyphosphate polymerase domain-containing protein [Bacteroidales bacterium]|nr:polyphosphate polymerase domain-containing protein [Bacteroidales bacterium]
MNILSAISKRINDAVRPSEGRRYERKFALRSFDFHQVLNMIKHHPDGFREIYSKRQVNNIYLDTLDLKTYFDNVHGNTTRVKVRIRWYGDTFGTVDKPVLELKIKNGLSGKKRSFQLNPFTLDRNFTIDTLKEALEHPVLPAWVKEKLSGYRPSLLNSYLRNYFVSSDRKVRITIDEKLTYYRIGARNNSFVQHFQDPGAIIVEMKYDLEASDSASAISQHFPMRMTKSSKYVNGIDIFHPELAT